MYEIPIAFIPKSFTDVFEKTTLFSFHKLIHYIYYVYIHCTIYVCKWLLLWNGCL